MSAGEIRKGSYLTVIVTMTDENGAMDVSAATVKQVILEPPTRTDKSANAASFTTDGTDGKIQYSFTPDEGGQWNRQGFVTVGGQDYYSDIYTFTVHENL